jgi:hypothetical protein
MVLGLVTTALYCNPVAVLSQPTSRGRERSISRYVPQAQPLRERCGWNDALSRLGFAKQHDASLLQLCFRSPPSRPGKYRVVPQGQPFLNLCRPRYRPLTPTLRDMLFLFDFVPLNERRR